MWMSGHHNRYLEILAHLHADVLGQVQSFGLPNAAYEQAAGDRQVEGVVCGLVRHNAHVGCQGIAGQVHLRHRV